MGRFLLAFYLRVPPSSVCSMPHTVEACPCPSLLFFSTGSLGHCCRVGKGAGGGTDIFIAQSRDCDQWEGLGGSFCSRFTPPCWEQNSPVLRFRLELYQGPLSTPVLTSAGLEGRESPAYSAFVAFTCVVTLYIGISISYWNADNFTVNYFLVLVLLCVTVRRCCTGICDTGKVQCPWISRPESAGVTHF